MTYSDSVERMEETAGHEEEQLPNIKSLLKLKSKYEASAPEDLPETYRTNSAKERLWLWCCDNYLRQLKFTHPHVKPLCLTPKNECGVEKFVCTFIKPTVLPFSHLHDVEACAAFVSDFIYYNPRQETVGCDDNLPLAQSIMDPNH